MLFVWLNCLKRRTAQHQDACECSRHVKHRAQNVCQTSIQAVFSQMQHAADKMLWLARENDVLETDIFSYLTTESQCESLWATL